MAKSASWVGWSRADSGQSDTRPPPLEKPMAGAVFQPVNGSDAVSTPSRDHAVRRVARPSTPMRRHQGAIGQAVQFGLRAVQISRPSEIRLTCSEKRNSGGILACRPILFGIAIDDVVTYDFSEFNQVVVWNHASRPPSGTSFFRTATGGGEPGYSGQRGDPNRRRTPDHNEEGENMSTIFATIIQPLIPLLKEEANRLKND